MLLANELAARPDAPVTLSKSCTDKITLKQCTSLLSSGTSLIIHPCNAYLSTLVISESQHTPKALTRAFGSTGRMSTLRTDSEWPGGFSFRPFEVKTSTRDFEYSRCNTSAGQRIVASNISTIWTPSSQEAIIGGILQGRRRGDPKGASSVCRKSMWEALVIVAASLQLPVPIQEALNASTYKALKEHEVLQDRRKVKEDVTREALKGWTRNEGDDTFRL
jgi:tRNA-specific adenosine deaminase 1